MPECVLRVGGDFDAIEFLRGSSLRPYAVESNGFKASASEADGDNLSAQIEDVIAFLRRNFASLESLPDVDARLDFGIFVRDFFDFPAQSIRLPAELLLLAGSLRTDIELSHYAVSGDEQNKDDELL